MKSRNIAALSLVLLMLIAVPGLLRAQEAKAYFHFFGGLNRVFDYGCDCDYEQGVDDFPVTPQHTTANVGMSFGYLLGRGFGIELDGRYHSNAEVTLTDPSDGDTVDIDTAKHYSITASLIYRIFRGGSTPYLVARSYMIRLEQGDFDSPESLKAIAAQARMSPEEFTRRYRYMVDESAVKLPSSLARAQVIRVVDDPIASHRDEGKKMLPM